jgi:hypothetical protein
MRFTRSVIVFLRNRINDSQVSGVIIRLDYSLNARSLRYDVSKAIRLRVDYFLIVSKKISQLY